MNDTRQLVIDAVIPSYNGMPLVADTITSLLNQQLPSGCLLTVTVVDDGSSDNTCALLKDRFDGRIHILRNSRNQGRSTACNTGAAHGKGDYILFLDSDCVPTGTSYLSEHLRALNAGADVSCGIISSLRNDFWAEYQHRLTVNRQKSVNNPAAAPGGTTANILVKRSSFEKAGGFDTRYKHYGFEDRDLLLCMKNTGSVIRYTSTAVVSHEDDLDLRKICMKMQMSGQYSSLLFRENHPQAYKSMAYYRFDARVHPWLKFISLISTPALPLLTVLFNAILETRQVPFGMRSMGVKFMSAMYYLKGTTLPGKLAVRQ
jgi:glycosyltransferase involved in cell wall biosynthesis